MQPKRKIIILGKRDHRDPLCRFYFDALASQLTLRGEVFAWISPEDDLVAPLDSSDQYIVNFFYKDADAINAIKQFNRGKFTSICFCSDIENYSDYQQAFEVSDVFVCPTLMHQKILQYVYGLPTFVLRESIDPILQQVPEKKFKSISTDLVWFGFSESYQRSMVNIESVIIESLRNQWINSFTVISSRSIRKSLPSEFNFIEYRIEEFVGQIQSFNFAILSHAPLDLHLNTFIKSPNKAISAIASGILPICSDTPNYRLLMEGLKLSPYIFRSPSDLLKILKDLSGRVKREDFSSTWHHANRVVRSLYSAELQCDEYFKILDQIPSQRDGIWGGRLANLKLFIPPNTDIKFRFYLRQQLKKLKDAFRLKRP